MPAQRGLHFSYMHDGRFSTLEQVLDHFVTNVKQSLTLDPILQQISPLGIPLTDDKKLKIIAFFKTLSDEQFVKDWRFSDLGFGKAF